MTRKRLFIFVGILALALILRCLFLEQRGITYDDAFSILLSRQSLGNIISGTAADTMPPLYYFLLHFWMRVGSSLWYVRLLSVFLSMAVLLLLYRLTVENLNEVTALWAMFLAAISPFQIYHAQELRMYSLLALGLLGYMLFFMRIWKAYQVGRVPLREQFGLVICGALSMYTHNLAVFSLAASFFVVLVHRKWKLLGQLTLAGAVILMLFSPWLFYVPEQVEKIQRAFWTPRPGLVQVVQAMMMFVVNLPLEGLSLQMGAVISLQIIILMVYLLIKRRCIRGIPGVLSILMVLPPLLLFAASYIMRPVFVVRGFILSTLLFYVLVAHVITQDRIIRWIMAAGFLIASAFALPFQYQYDRFPRSPFCEAVTYLGNVIQPGEVIIHDNKLSAFPAIYFAPDLPQVFIADEPGSHNDTLALASQQAMLLYPEPSVAVAAQGVESLYFVSFDKAFQEYQQMGKAHPALSWLQQRYVQSDRTVIGDLVILHFSQPRLQGGSGG